MNVPNKRAIMTAAAVVFALLWMASSARADAYSILGIWNESENDAQFEIYKCGSFFYCGRIHSLREPNYPPADRQMPGRPKVDRNNPEPRLRNRPLSGLPFMIGFRYKGGNSWKGKIYNSENGKTYNCKLSMSGPDRLNVRGYLGVSLFGKTVTWTRSK